MPAPEQQQPVASSAANGWIIVLLMSSATALALAFGRFGYGVLLPAVRDDMSISNTLAGAIAGANAAAYLGGTLLIAWLAGHYRLLSILRAGIALVVLGLLGAAMSTSPQMLMLSLGLAGLGGTRVCSKSDLYQSNGELYFFSSFNFFLLFLLMCLPFSAGGRVFGSRYTLLVDDYRYMSF